MSSHPRLFSSTALVSGATLLSRLLGFVRDAVIASLFGTGPAADAFLVAFRIPNFLRRLLGEGAFSQAFIPVLSEQIGKGDAAGLRDLVDHAYSLLLATACLITLVAVVAAPVVVVLVAPGYAFGELDAQQEKYALVVTMLRITFPYLVLISLTAFATSILNCYRRFGWPALTPILLNLSLIGAAIWLSPRLEQPVVALAWGVLVGGLLQLAWQLPLLKKLGLLPSFRLNLRHPGVVRIFRLLVPATVGVSVSQINLLFDTILASFLVTGSVSWLYYSDRLMELPLSLFAIALGTVLLPHLSRLYVERNPQLYKAALDWALRWVVLLGLPAATGLFVLAGPLLTTLFQYGHFSANDVVQADASLKAYALALPGAMLVKVLAPAFYARQDVRTPVRIAIIALLSNMLLNVLLIVPFAHAGLALATAVSASINAYLLYRTLSSKGVFSPLGGWRPFLSRVILGCLVMAIVLSWFAGGLDTWLAATAPQRGWLLAQVMSGGLLAYALALLASGLNFRAMLRPARAEQSLP